jgi:hypothetical protein
MERRPPGAGPRPRDDQHYHYAANRGGVRTPRLPLRKPPLVENPARFRYTQCQVMYSSDRSFPLSPEVPESQRLCLPERQ